MKNIVLIGMPGCGKSTLGVLLAKHLGFDFVDTDIVIQNLAGEVLYKILEKEGVNGLLDREQKAILSLDLEGTSKVISTGGSAVLRRESMEYLKRNGVCLYLKLSYEQIQKRINNRQTRGIAAENHETLLDIYNFRIPFYEKYADITVDCEKNSLQENLEKIINKLSQIR